VRRAFDLLSARDDGKLSFASADAAAESKAAYAHYACTHVHARAEIIAD